MTLFGPSDDARPAAPVGPAEVDSPSPRNPAPLAANSVRVGLCLAYDGSGFRGFAAQPGVPTVAGALGGALQAVVGHPVEITCAGRTDAGVHAAGQVVHFDIDRGRARDAYSGSEPDLAALKRSCNRMLAPAVVVRAAGVAAPGFDARRSALWRRYRYLVLNREAPDPFLARTTWHVEEPLDLGVMQLACDPLYGEHDFSAFCRRPTDGSSTTRRVMRADWTRAGELLVFEIVASAFCHQMVRSLVGTMVAMGRGRLTPGEMAGILRGGQRSRAASPAPPQGLCLEEVGYPPGLLA